MSKVIRLTDEYIEQCKAEFEEALRKGKYSDGKITYSKTLGDTDRRAVVYFTEAAYVKMETLVQEFDSEIAWHGVAYRSDEPNAYIISDILVYPQTVTGSTVDMDTKKYAEWLQKNDDDDRFFNIHMQGHSHVNMGVTPSAVDISHQEEILNQLDSKNFYIFMIVNKKHDMSVKIYDLRENVLFENRDIQVEVMDDAIGINKFLAEAKQMVSTESYQHTPKQYSNPSGYYKKNSKKPNATSGNKQSGGAKQTKNPGGYPYYGYNGIGYGYDSGYDDYLDDLFSAPEFRTSKKK